MREEEVLTNLTEEFESFITQIKNYEDKTFDVTVNVNDWDNSNQQRTDLTFDEYSALHPGSTEEEYNAYMRELLDSSAKGKQEFHSYTDKEIDKIEESIRELIRDEKVVIKNMIAEIDSVLAFCIARVNTLRVRLSNAKNKEEKFRIAEEMHKFETHAYFLKKAKKDARSYADFINKMDNYYKLDNHDFNYLSENQEKIDKLRESMDRITKDASAINDSDLTVEINYNEKTGKYDVKCTCMGLESECELTEEDLNNSRLQENVDKFLEDVARKTGKSLLSLRYNKANVIKNGNSLGKVLASDLNKGIENIPVGTQQPQDHNVTQGPTQSAPVPGEGQPVPTPGQGQSSTPEQGQPVPAPGQGQSSTPEQGQSAPTPGQEQNQTPEQNPNSASAPEPTPAPTEPTTPAVSNQANNTPQITPQEMTRIISHRKYRKQQNTATAIRVAGGIATLAAVGLLSVGAPVAVPVAALLGTLGASATYTAHNQIKLACINHTLRKIARKFGLTFVANPNPDTGEVYFVKEIEGQSPIIITDANAASIVQEGTSYTLQDELNRRFKNDLRGLGDNFSNEKERKYRNLSKVTVGNLGAAYEIVGGYRRPIIESRVPGLEEVMNRTQQEASETPALVAATPQDANAPTTETGEPQPTPVPEQGQPVPAPEQGQPVPAPEQGQPAPAPEQEQPIPAPEQEQPVQAPEQGQPVPEPASEATITPEPAPLSNPAVTSNDGIDIKPFTNAESLGNALSDAGNGEFVPSDARTNDTPPTASANQFTDAQIQNMIALYGEENTYENIIASNPAYATEETKNRISRLAASLQPKPQSASLGL